MALTNRFIVIFLLQRKEQHSKRQLRLKCSHVIIEAGAVCDPQAAFALKMKKVLVRQTVYLYAVTFAL